tara:strand:+ start:29 stop:850 length:822 start_codon:yes stop_codon:yes gene_type:complete
MKNLQMFCLTLEPNHYNFIKELGYSPVGLGDKNFDSKWFSDRSEENISKKNKNYGEYTFHYWIWKNYLDKLDSKWIGFCQYRKFWSLSEYENNKISFDNLNNKVLKQIPAKFDEYESIIGTPIFVNQWKPMKFIKKGLKFFIKKPLVIFNKGKRNINFHFDLMHGENNLSKAINLLDEKNKNDFSKYVNSEVSFSPHNMFICNSKTKMKNYYQDLFSWLDKCEKLFGFDNLKGYGKIRIYGFLAERFMSYWFKKNTKYITLPIIFYDIRKDLN